MGAHPRLRAGGRGRRRAGGSVGSASLQQEIGLGKAEAIEEIEIWWPGQEGRQVFRGAEMDRAYLAEEGATMLQPVRGGDS